MRFNSQNAITASLSNLPSLLLYNNDRLIYLYGASINSPTICEREAEIDENHENTVVRNKVLRV